MRKWVWISSAVVVLALGAGALSLPLVLRARLRARLAERGLQGDIKEVTLRPTGAHFLGLEVSLPGHVGALKLDDISVDVDWWTLGVRDLHVEGGTLELHGTPNEVEGALKRIRGDTKESNGKESAERYVSVRRLQVEWDKVDESDLRLSGSNLQLDHGPGGTKLGVDLIRVRQGEQRLAIVGTVLESSGKTGSTHIESASVAEVFFASREKSEREAVAKTTASGDARHPQEPSEPSVFGLDDNRAARLREKLEVVRRKLLPIFPTRFEAKKVSFELLLFGESLHIGPASLSVTRGDGRVTATLTPLEESTGQNLALSLNLTEGEGDTELGLVGGPVSLKQLGIHEGDFALSSVERAFLSGDIRLKLSKDAEVLHARGSAHLLDLGVSSSKLAATEVTFPRVGTSFDLEARVNGSRVDVKDSSVEIGEAKLKGTLTLERLGSSFRLVSDWKSSLVSCQSLLNSLPNALLSNVKDIELRGTVSMASHWNFDSEHWGRAKVSLDVGGDCEVKSLPKSLDPTMFRRPFTREVEGPSDVPTTLTLGPGCDSWTDKGSFSPFLEKAVLVTEDGRFLKHHGFDPRAIESSIVDNLKAGRFVRGASTISMQLAKNLYLSREKVLSRKLQELFLTMVLEQSFDKTELLELYFNVVELGPYVYGVKQAAEYYFKSTPSELTVMQSFFLASILPNPTKSHFDKKGKLLPGHAALLRKLVGIALERKLLTPEEAERANREELVFGSKDTTPEKAALDSGANISPEGASP